MIRDDRAALFEQFHDLQSRAFAHVVDILFVGDPDDEHPRPLDGATAPFAQRADQLADDVARHCGIDFAGEFNEPGGEIELARFPGQVERVDRDAVTAETGPGIKRHITEGLCLRGLDDLPDIDPHRLEDDLELVDQGDIDGAEDVFRQLHRFGGIGRGNRHGTRDDLVVKRASKAHRRIAVAADNLWNVARAKAVIARVFALGRVGEKEISPRPEAARLEDGAHDLARCAGVGRRFKDDELSRPQMRRDAFGRAYDVGQIGLALPGQRRRHAQDNRIDFGEAAKIVGCGKALLATQPGNALGLDMTDVGAAGIQDIDLVAVDIEAERRKAFLDHRPQQREPDIAETDDPDPGLAPAKALDQGFDIRGRLDHGKGWLDAHADQAL